jgi:hypothetical protein
MGLLRTAGAFRHLVSHGQARSDGDELWFRQARKDDQPVVAMRCVEADGDYVVSCEVYPVNRFVVEPVEPGPYVFASERDAGDFADAATLVFEYLGCEIAESRN